MPLGSVATGSHQDVEKADRAFLFAGIGLSCADAIDHWHACMPGRFAPDALAHRFSNRPLFLVACEQAAE
jgi:hypothetical protein